MSVQRLKVDDVVLFHQSNDASSQTLGLIRYIGLMYGSDVMTQYVGIELMEPIRNGHGGTIKGYSYFNTEIGYGTHCLLRNVIKRLRTSEMFSICKSKLKATKSNKDPVAKHNRNNINTPPSQESDKFSDQRSSILSDFDMFAPMTPFSPRNSLLSQKSQKSQKKSALHGKSIRMLKPRQSLSTPIAFPDTEPVAVIISEEQETKTERSKKRRKKKHKKTKKKRKRRQPKRKLERINSNETHDMPAFGAHSKSAAEHIADNKYVFQPQQPVQNHLYVPQIPYSNSASNSVPDLETTGYENDGRAQYQSHDNKYNAMHAMMPQQYEHNQPMKNNLYVPQIPYSHSASHSVMNLEDMARAQNHSNRKFQPQPRKNHLYAPPNAFAMAGFSHNRSSSVPALDMQSTSAPEISKRVHYEQPKNTTHGNGNNEQFTSYKQYLYEPINNIEAKLKQLQSQNSTNNFRFIGCH